MSIRYTLRLVENGAEVWKRWTGDREEALRDLAATLPDLDISAERAENFAALSAAIDPATLGGPGSGHTTVVHTKDLNTRLTFEVRRKG